MLNSSFDHYKLYTTLDVPDIKTILMPTNEPSSSFGAKSVAEISINKPLPAIASAVFDAIGIRLRDAPLTPVKVLMVINQKNKNS